MVWNSLKNILVEKGEIFWEGILLPALPKKRTNDSFALMRIADILDYYSALRMSISEKAGL